MNALESSFGFLYHSLLEFCAILKSCLDSFLNYALLRVQMIGKYLLPYRLLSRLEGGRLI